MKYLLLDNDVVNFNGKTLHRICALKSFDGVKSGELGGYIESESNLSHDGNAWVSDNAIVCDDAWVSGNANVCGNAKVFGNAIVCGNALVFGNAIVCGNALVVDSTTSI